jgi:outer membrane lipoprotein-sorting protein
MTKLDGRSARAGRVLLVIAAVLVPGVAVAEPAPPSAATMLANVQQFYAKANHLAAQFHQSVTNAMTNITKVSNGELWVATPAQLRWDYLEKRPAGVKRSKTFVFDGATLWLVDHQNKKIFQNDVANSAVPAVVSFLTGGAALTKEFNVALDTSGTFGGANATVLALTPKQPSAQYKQLFFVVDRSDWHISESISINSNGDTNAFTFSSLDLKSTVDAGWFQVSPTKLPSYELVVVGKPAG